jgi:hypothetical protein
MKINRLLSLAVILSSCFAYCAPTAYAVCRVPGVKVSGEFFKSDIVFVGTVISTRYESPGRDVGGWLYRLRMDKIFRGTAQGEFTIYTEDSDIRFPLVSDQRYLLFAYRIHGRLWIDNCGNSRLLSEASESVRSLERIPHETDGEVEGWIARETHCVDVSGVRVTIRGGSKVYSAITDSDGWFHFQASPVATKWISHRPNTMSMLTICFFGTTLIISDCMLAKPRHSNLCPSGTV